MLQSIHCTVAEVRMSHPILRRLAASCAALLLAAAAPWALAQQSRFPSADAAADALVDAVARSDEDAVRAMLGAGYRQVLQLGEVSQDDKLKFLAAWAESRRVVPQGEGKAVLEVGKTNWPMPIPIVKTAGGWVFDTRAGADELVTRRIGRNELSAMEAALAYFDAQKEYASKERVPGRGLVYAQQFFSSPGKKDGLYWEAAPGEPPSPLGPAYAVSGPEGGYHGYHFRILTGQGKNAQGGAYDYRHKGRMNAGFALVAWPVTYGKTGIMSFMVSHDGVVYQKNLGPGGDAVARGMQRFDPDPGWQVVRPPSTVAAAGSSK
jgi:hypothetical protein